MRVGRAGTHQDALGDGDGRRGQRSFFEAGRRRGRLAAARAEGRSHDELGTLVRVMELLVDPDSTRKA